MPFACVLPVKGNISDLVLAISTILEKYEREVIVKQSNIVLASQCIEPVENIPELLKLVYGIDYHEVKGIIRVINVIRDVKSKGNTTCYLRSKDYDIYQRNKDVINNVIKNGNSIVSFLKEYCFRKGLHLNKRYISNQTVRKIFLLKRGDSGNPDIEEETRLDRIKNRHTPPPRNKRQITEEYITNYLISSINPDNPDNDILNDWYEYLKSIPDECLFSTIDEKRKPSERVSMCHAIVNEFIFTLKNQSA